MGANRTQAAFACLVAVLLLPSSAPLAVRRGNGLSHSRRCIPTLTALQPEDKPWPRALRPQHLRAFAASLASACLMLGPDGVHLLDASGDPAMAMLRPPIASAALSDEQRLVAETWRTVDRLFVDRTFNNHGDW